MIPPLVGGDHVKPRVLYVSYDGVGEPLGRSQVLSYLYRLAGEYDITLVSFEKTVADREVLRAELTQRGIRWHPLEYHKRPPVLSTLLDVVTGALELAKCARRSGRPAIVHVRSYVPALIALVARPATGGKLIFDIRGFWADERVEGGIWPADSRLYQWLYLFAKRCERRFFASADAIVTLTDASVPQIATWTAGRDVPIDVIPTCADLELFTRHVRRPEGPRVTWVGSIGTWYRFDLAAALADALEMPLGVVTRQVELARDAMGDGAVSIKTLPLAEVPGELFNGDVGLCLYVSSFSRMATAPTRFAEYLAAGMPVVVTPGVGDLERFVTDHRVGAVLDGDDSAAIVRAATRITELLTDPELVQRCQALAGQAFDVDAGSRRYSELYRGVLAR